MRTPSSTTTVRRAVAMLRNAGSGAPTLTGGDHVFTERLVGKTGRDKIVHGTPSAASRATPADIGNKPHFDARRETGRAASTPGAGAAAVKLPPILSETGYRSTEIAGRKGAHWLDPNGKPVDPKDLRDRVAEEVRKRVASENWPAGKTLEELHRNRNGLPREESDRAEVALALLPLIPAVAGAAGSSGAAGAASGSAWLSTILGGAALLSVLGLSGDTPKSKAREKDREREHVTVYRVEGDEHQRVIVDKNGGVFINFKNKNMLFLNFGDRKRAEEFLQRKLDKKDVKNPVIKSFLVGKEFLDKLRRHAIKQKRATSVDPGKKLPQKVDETKAEDETQFGIRHSWFGELQRKIQQGTGRIETPEDVGIR